MEFMQMIYTSCRKGIYKKTGLQTYSLSKDISDDDRTEIEKLGVYGVNSFIEKLNYPIKYSYKKLKSGKYCILKSQYIGLDYMGKPGNYICHAFIFEIDKLTEYPSEFIESRLFRKCLTSEEINSENVPNYLNNLNVTPKSKIQYDDLRNFFKNQDNLNALKFIISTILNTNKKQILIIDKYENIPIWIKSINISFPLKISKNLFFTTLSTNFKDDGFNIFVTSEIDSKLLSNDSYFLKKFFIFDMHQKKYQINYFHNYSELVQTAFSISMQPFLEYIKFANIHEFDLHSNDLLVIYNIFNLREYKIVDFSVEEYLNMIQYTIYRDNNFENYIIEEIISNCLISISKLETNRIDKLRDLISLCKINIHILKTIIFYYSQIVKTNENKLQELFITLTEVIKNMNKYIIEDLLNISIQNSHLWPLSIEIYKIYIDLSNNKKEIFLKLYNSWISNNFNDLSKEFRILFDYYIKNSNNDGISEITLILSEQYLNSKFLESNIHEYLFNFVNENASFYKFENNLKYEQNIIKLIEIKNKLQSNCYVLNLFEIIFQLKIEMIHKNIYEIKNINIKYNILPENKYIEFSIVCIKLLTKNTKVYFDHKWIIESFIQYIPSKDLVKKYSEILDDLFLNDTNGMNILILYVSNLLFSNYSEIIYNLLINVLCNVLEHKTSNTIKSINKYFENEIKITNENTQKKWEHIKNRIHTRRKNRKMWNIYGFKKYL